MKKLFAQTITCLLACFLLYNLSSCSKPVDVIDNPTNDGTGQPVGQAIGEAWTEAIGSAGGIVTSTDKRIQIEIPAGALTQETEISIQPLRNTAKGGIGVAYRLAPHGTIFKKKVTIRFHYANDELELSNTEAIEIAYQNEKGIWVCHGGTTNNKVKKTVSIETDHFSDWALVSSMELTPAVKTVGLGESVSLKAIRYVYPVNENDFLVPLTIPDVNTGEPSNIEQQYIVKWTLNGSGKLDVNGSEATYTAPSSMPADKTVTVTLELNVRGKQVLLISTIYIIGDGISISIDGAAWTTWPGMSMAMTDVQQYNLSSLRISADIPQIVFIWPMIQGKPSDGTYNWSMLGNESEYVVFQYAEPDLKKMYVSVYDEDGEQFDSPGFLKVEEITEGGKKYTSASSPLKKPGA